MSLLDTLKKQATHIAKAEANRAKNELRSQVEKKIYTALNTKKVKVTVTSLPASLEEFTTLYEQKKENQYEVAALAILALNIFRKDKEEGKKVLEYFNGPADVNGFDLQFINDRFMDGKDYVVDSYFQSTSPENNYQFSLPATITIIEQSNSYSEENYAKLFIESTGADSPRQVTLRYKPSSKQWFLWDYKLLLAEVVKPIEKDEWA